VASADTLRQMRATVAPRPGAVLSLPVDLPQTLAPGEYRYVLRVSGGPASRAAPADTARDELLERPDLPGAGFVLGGTVEVPAAAPSGPAISAIAIGDPAESGWRRHGDPLLLNPAHTIPVARRSVAVYYELYGLTTGEAIRTELTVERPGLRLFGRKRHTITFEGVATPAEGIHAESRVLDASLLESGEHTLRIRVKTASGSVVERTTTLVLREPDELEP